MERQEKIARLMERMGVTAEQAAQALDACGGDLLDAALFLEQQRPVGERAVHTHSTAAAMIPAPQAAEAGEKTAKAQPSAGDTAMEIFLAILTGLVTHPILNGLRLESKGRHVVTVPGFILLLLLLARCWVVLGLTAIGLLAGWHFVWAGPQWDNAALNRAWGLLEGKADELRESVKGGHRRA